MELAVSGFTAALLTLFDLDRTFYVPASEGSKAKLWAWWWGFIFANGLAASGLYIILRDLEPFRGMNPLLRSLLIGASYLALIRLKLTTFSIQGREIPLGFEPAYEGAKSFVYKRINSIAKAARFRETTELAARETLLSLAPRARLNIEQDALLTADDKRKSKAWVLSVLQDSSTSDEDKRLALADFILSGHRAGE